MKIKLCGIRRWQDIEYVNEFCPDYIGFVFAESPRRITAQQAQKLTEGLRNNIQKVGVFVNERINYLLETAQIARLDVLQLHGDEGIEYISQLKKKTELPVWKAVRVKSACDIVQADMLPVEALLLDSFSHHAYGGTGHTANWDIIEKVDRKKAIFLAGGLHAGNLAQAIQKVKPFGVDLSGGVETQGVKDREKIKEVMELFRQIQTKDNREIGERLWAR